MPGKARRRKVKYSAPKKRKKERTSHPTVLYEQSRVTETRKPVSSPSISASVASAPEPMPKPALIQHPYISSELRTIGILAGIMLVILIILAVVMS
jgi:hypothetical protein